jgi:N-hydroxyarylamine O-acetyltransferase
LAKERDNSIVDITKYLARIGMDRTGVMPDIAGLKLLQRQHLLNVPFENLDIHWGRPIILDKDALYRKIVKENRGGFCYELNGLFNELLREIGFETRLLSARVADSHGSFSPEFDHAAILVIIGEMQYIADVGFGEFTAGPLHLVEDVKQTDQAGTFIVRRFDQESFEIAKQIDIGWRTEYMFKPLGHALLEFEERCLWHQTSPDSHFRKGKVCSLMTLAGRKTLADDKYIVTTEDGRTELRVTDENEFDKILLGEFGISRPVSSQSFSLADQYIQ